MSFANTQCTKVLSNGYVYKLETESFQKMVKSWGATLAGVGDVREGLADEFRHLPIAVSLAVSHPPIAQGMVPFLLLMRYWKRSRKEQYLICVL